MLIRKFESADTVRCLEIYNYYIKSSFLTLMIQPLTAQAFADHATKITARYPFYVAEDGGRVIGFAYLSEHDTPAAYRYSANLSIYVDSAQTHCGAGSGLFAEIEREAKRLGIKNIISLVVSGNESSAAFHKKAGFSYAGTLKNVGYKFGEWLSVMYFQKEF